MGKKQLTALIIILVAFFGCFYLAFLNFDMSNPFLNLMFFVMFLAGTVASLAVGNSGAR